MSQRLIALVAVAAVPLILLWMVIDGLRTGVIRSRGGRVERADHPVFYWAAVALYLGCIGLFVYFVSPVFLNVWRSGS